MLKAISFIFIVWLQVATLIYGEAINTDLSSRYLFDQQGKLNDSVISIIEKATGSLPNTFFNAVEITQNKWLRKPGTERWEMDNKTALEQYASFLLPLFQKIGLIDTINPSQKKYDYALVMGAGTTVVINRLKYLDNQMSQGLIVHTIVLLTGDRDLTDNEKVFLNKNFDASIDQMNNETDMMQFLFANKKLFPHLASINYQVINTPKQQLPNGTLRRPNTADTLIAWLKEKPRPGTCLVISSQPYVGYQDTVTKTYLSDNFTFESSGSPDATTKTVALYLDTLARWLYQEYIYQTKNNSRSQVSI